MTVVVLTTLAVILCAALAVLWARKIGPLRGLGAALCRLMWLLPIVWTLNPETITEQLPSILVQQPIHILLDDSVSMRGGRVNGSLSDELKTSIKDIEETCQRFGCLPKIVRLSELRSETAKGFTPLSAALEPWLFKIGAEPWILLSDGADWRPSRLWDERLRGRGAIQSLKNLGLVVSFGTPATPGFWLEDVALPSFAFESRPVQMGVRVSRANSVGVEIVQIQAAVDGKALMSASAVFADGAAEAHTELSFLSPARGPHLITVKSLPVGNEKDIWDNELNIAIDVLPNTIGVLHLLGSPSWDGRFLRRYLKSEPKFDLISFFILRDPWDSQQVSERELSLIPFPVERLFKEELASFRVLVIQNFTMQQFLQPEFQTNLVKFVLGGGGLLFIGGPRALTEGDIANSPIAEILPFSLQSNHGRQGLKLSLDDRIAGQTFESETKFRVELSDPDIQKRSLATVYDDWQKMAGRLTNLKDMKGIHQMSSFKFKQDAVTPLLQASLEGGSKVPLAVASYPGKGRAIWLFTDSMWRLGMDEDPERSRFDYHDFFDGALTWLMRNDRRSSLVASRFRVERSDDDRAVLWSVRLSGPAARFVGSRGSEWKVSICGNSMPLNSFSSEQHGPEEWTLSGSTVTPSHAGSMCGIKIEGQHQSFGSVEASSLAVFSETLKDSEMSPSPRKLRLLSELTGAKFISATENRSQIMADWLRTWTGAESQSLPNRFKTVRDFYWVFNRPWIWLVVLLLPLEVLIRRWHLMVGRESSLEIQDEGVG